MDAIPPQLVNFREGYLRLEKQVQLALRTQMGDATRLAHQSNRVAAFLDAAEQVWRVLYSLVISMLKAGVFAFAAPTCVLGR